jgi:hypothetical protein
VLSAAETRGHSVETTVLRFRKLLAMSTGERRGFSGARWFAAFSFLILAVHEAHELVHAITGRLVCGQWPVRDFNAWRFAGKCASVLPTAAGPAFSYGLMAAGAWMATRSRALRFAGIALLFAANPFARIFTVAMGGGDEMVVAQRVTSSVERTMALRMATLAVVLLVCGPVLIAAWRALRDVRRRALWFFLAMLWPMVLTGVGLFVVGNGLLRQGFLVTPVITGAPLLVLLVSCAAMLLTAATLPWFRSRSEG